MQRRSHEHSSHLSIFFLSLFSLSLIFCLTVTGSAQETRQNSQSQSSLINSGVRAGELAGVHTPVINRAGNDEGNDAYRIGPGDLLDVRVFNQADLSRAVRVSAQGDIRLPFVGDLKAACLSESELALIIADKYKKYINEPQVDVFVREYQSQPVAVIGAVEKPAQFQLQRRVKLLELLTFAGGPTKDAGHVVHVIHGGSYNLCALDKSGADEAASGAGEISFTSYKLSDLLSGGAAASIYVVPGDVVSVPEAEQIFVTGMVVRPGPVKMMAGTTLTQAIAMAGGTTAEAGRKVRLLRKKAGSSILEEQVFNIEDIQKRKIEDVRLEASDVVDVSNSAGRSVAQSLLRQIAPTLGLLPYVIRR